MIRYQVIDRCLRHRTRCWTAADLAEACAEALTEQGFDIPPPSRSTISRDLKTMRSAPPLGYDAPIEWDASINTFYYRDPEFSISGSPLREDDLQALADALSILRQFQYFEHQVNELENITTRVEQGLRLERRQGPPVLYFTQPDYPPAGRWLYLLYRACVHRYCLRLQYQPFQEDGFAAVVSPYLLKEYNNRWFLIAYRHDLRQLRTFALDRIQAADHYLLDNFYQMPAFNSETYFRDVIGVSVYTDRSVERIRFRTPHLRARYLRTKAVHHSLRVIREHSEYVEFELRVIPNFELENWILSFAEEIRILQPQWLADKIRSRHEQAAAAYVPND